jgi:hypothetical protein
LRTVHRKACGMSPRKLTSRIYSRAIAFMRAHPVMYIGPLAGGVGLNNLVAELTAFFCLSSIPGRSVEVVVRVAPDNTVTLFNRRRVPKQSLSNLATYIVRRFHRMHDIEGLPLDIIGCNLLAVRSLASELGLAVFARGAHEDTKLVQGPSRAGAKSANAIVYLRFRPDPQIFGRSPVRLSRIQLLLGKLNMQLELDRSTLVAPIKPADDKDGAVRRVPRDPPGNRPTPAEKVCSVDLEDDPDFIYFVDGDGDVCCRRRARPLTEES